MFWSFRPFLSDDGIAKTATRDPNSAASFLTNQFSILREQCKSSSGITRNAPNKKDLRKGQIEIITGWGYVAYEMVETEGLKLVLDQVKTRDVPRVVNCAVIASRGCLLPY
jgi:hypothetical protein